MPTCSQYASREHMLNCVCCDSNAFIDVRNMRGLFTGKTIMRGGGHITFSFKTCLGGTIKCPLAIGNMFVWRERSSS